MFGYAKELKGSMLRKGRQKCFVWLGQQADGFCETTTPSKTGDRDEIDRLESV